MARPLLLGPHHLVGRNRAVFSHGERKKIRYQLPAIKWIFAANNNLKYLKPVGKRKVYWGCGPL